MIGIDDYQGDHPWGNFLKARVKCIEWLKEMNASDQHIASCLSMDDEQVYWITKGLRKNERI